jgi:hypothetical protein
MRVFGREGGTSASIGNDTTQQVDYEIALQSAVGRTVTQPLEERLRPYRVASMALPFARAMSSLGTPWRR